MPLQQADQTIVQKVLPLLETANRVPAIAWMMRAWDASFALNIDGEQLFLVSSGGQVELLRKRPPVVDVSFALTERTLDQLIAGKLSPLTAKLTGRLNSTGPTPEILRFAAVFTACLQQARSGSRSGPWPF